MQIFALIFSSEQPSWQRPLKINHLPQYLHGSLAHLAKLSLWICFIGHKISLQINLFFHLLPHVVAILPSVFNEIFGRVYEIQDILCIMINLPYSL